MSDELVQWLKDRLASTYLINNDSYYEQDISIRIWKSLSSSSCPIGLAP
ncbi:unnamed protein product, partial [Rotaria sp. Silwood2]